MQDYFSLKDNIFLQTHHMYISSAHNELESTQFQVYYTTAKCPLHHYIINNFHHIHTLQRRLSVI
jgi:hypothetical protein